jgi:hypothetical protein
MTRDLDQTRLSFCQDNLALITMQENLGMTDVRVWKDFEDWERGRNGFTAMFTRQRT